MSALPTFELSPSEGFYLLYPFQSYGDDLIILTLKGLILRSLLHVEVRNIQVDSRSLRRFPRVFISRPSTPSSDKLSRAEEFVVSLFDREPIRFYQFRNRVTSHFKKDIQGFKQQYLRLDLKEKKQLNFLSIRSMKGWQYARKLRRSLLEIEDHHEFLMEKNPKQLKALLESIGFNFLLLAPLTIKNLALDNRLLQFGRFMNEEFRSLNDLDILLSVGLSEMSFSSTSDISLFEFGGGEFDGGGAGDIF